MCLTISLFVHMEYLRGHYTSALIHLRSGWNLFRRSDSLEMDGYLLTCFTRLLVQAKLAGQLVHIRVPMELIHTPSYETFRSPEHARRELENIILRASNHETREPLESALAQWRKVHERTPSSTVDMASFAYRLLKLYYHIAMVIVGTYGKSEMAVDAFNPTFLEIVRQSVNTYNMLQPGGLYGHLERSSLKSISDIGWIAPLYITAIRCRIPRLRHQCIRLLEIVQHKEGIFDSHLATTVAREICNVEGQNDLDTFDVLEVPSTEVLTKATLPLSSRVSDLRVELPADSQGLLTLSYNHENRALCRQYNLSTGIWSYVSNLCPVNSSLTSHNFSAAL